MVTPLWPSIWLLADRYRWERLGDAFSPENAALTTSELVALGAILAVGALLAFILVILARRQEQRRPYSNPKRLFRDLCRLHRLGRRERRLLCELAEENGLKQPAFLFVQPEAFAAAEQAPHRAHQRNQIRALRSRLFASQL